MSTVAGTPVSRVVPSSAAWLAVVAATAGGALSLSLVDQVVLLGIAVVLPLALGGRTGWWAAAAAALIALCLPRGGPAVVAALPFVAVAAATLVARARAAGPPARWGLTGAADVVAATYALVAAGALVQSRAGVVVLDLREPIVELTAVHYMFAGSAALTLARLGRTAAPRGRWHAVGGAAVVLTGVAPPVVAAGFLTGLALPQLGGAVAMALGVWATAGLELAQAGAAARRDPLRAGLLGVSGLAVWLPMVLAVAWAAGQHWAVPALSIPDMARTHGLANALGFILCGLVARQIGERGARPPDRSPAGTVPAVVSL